MEQFELVEQVYYSVLGELIPEYHLSWVEDINVPGHPCFESYERMMKAYEHLRERLGIEDEDKDAEIMIDSLLEQEKIVAMEMFRYGRKYERMQAGQE